MFWGRSLEPRKDTVFFQEKGWDSITRAKYRENVEPLIVGKIQLDTSLFMQIGVCSHNA